MDIQTMPGGSRGEFKKHRRDRMNIIAEKQMGVNFSISINILVQMKINERTAQYFK